MTVAAIPRSIDYADDGVTVAFAVPWRFNDPADVKARFTSASGVRTDLVYGVDFSVTGGDTDAGGELTLVAASARAGGTVSIWTETPRGQTADYETNGTFPAETHEARLDQLAMVDQEQDVELRRSLQVPRGETAAELPPMVDLKGRVLGFHPTTGEPIAVSADAVGIAADRKDTLAAATRADGALTSVLALASGVLFADTAAGLAATEDGATFAVADGTVVKIYRNETGSATYLLSLPSNEAVQTALNVVRTFADVLVVPDPVAMVPDGSYPGAYSTPVTYFATRFFGQVVSGDGIVRVTVLANGVPRYGPVSVGVDGFAEDTAFTVPAGASVEFLVENSDPTLTGLYLKVEGLPV